MSEQSSSPQRISLAAAVFDFPAPPGHSTPQQNVPDSWLELFISEHADAGVFLGVFTSCRAGRAWALRTAPQLQVALDCTSTGGFASQQRMLQAVWAALRTRSTQPGLARASVTVKLEDTPESAIAAGVLLGSLPQAEPNLGALTIEWPRPEEIGEEEALSVDDDFIQAVAQAVPSLTSLTVNHCIASIPAPSLLPHLTHIDLTTEQEVVDEICSSIAPFLPQIRSLTLNCCLPDLDLDYFEDSDTEDDTGIPWRTLFAPDQITHTLTTLTTNAPLTDWLVELILDHAPAMRDLTTASLAVGLDWVERGKEWEVQRLCFTQYDIDIHAGCLALLPSTKEGHVCVEGSDDGRLVFPAVMNEGPEARIPAHMHQWKLRVGEIVFRRNWAPEPDPPEQLCRMLRMLSLLAQPSTGTVHFEALHFTIQPLQLLAELLPDMGDLRFDIDLGTPLTDELLGVVVGMGLRVRTLTCPSLALESEQHTNTLWPWESFKCKTLDLSHVCRLPDPAGAEERVVCVDELVIGTEPDVVGRCMRSASTRLPHIQFKPILWHNPYSNIQVTLKGPHTNNSTQMCQLNLLKHVRFVSKYIKVSLVGWDMTQETYNTLKSLPGWEMAEFDVSQCMSWPLDAATNARMLLSCLPKGFTAWRLPDTELHRQMQGMVARYGCEGSGQAGPHYRCVVGLVRQRWQRLSWRCERLHCVRMNDRQ